METIVEYLRTKMIQMAEQRGSLTHPDVVAVSQQLDQFLVLIQRKRLTMNTDTERNALIVNRHFGNGRKRFRHFDKPVTIRSRVFVYLR